MSMRCPFSEWHCLICGTCTSVPDDLTLVRWLSSRSVSTVPESSLSDTSLDESQFTWLGRTHIVGGPDQQLLPQEALQSATDQSASVMLTGVTRQRRDQIQFARGNVRDVDFEGMTRSVRGHGSKELISISYPDLLELRMMAPSVYLTIHSRCLDILSRVRRHKCCSTISGDDGEVDFNAISNQLFDRLRRNWQHLPKQDWNVAGVWQSVPMIPRKVLDKDQTALIPKHCLFDPCASDYLQSIQSQFAIGKKHEHTSECISDDRLSLLPAEILFSIAQLLIPREIRYLTQASTSARCVISFSRGFWSARIKADLPWLWELRDQDKIWTWTTQTHEENDEECYDWQELHLFLTSIGSPSSSRCMASMVNRRRIWALCEVLVEAEDTGMVVY